MSCGIAKLYLGVLSNKDESLVQVICEHFFPGLFFPCMGLRNGRPPKPDPAAVREMLRIWKLKASEVLLVGDSEVDVETARRSSLRVAGVTWGYRSGDVLQRAGVDVLVHQPAEILPHAQTIP